MKAALPRAWLARRRGTPDQAALYCQEDDNFVEHGVDLHTISASIIAGDKMRAVALAQPEDVLINFLFFFLVGLLCMVHHKASIRGMWALRYITAPERFAFPEVRVFYGATNVGKSFRAREWLGMRLIKNIILTRGAGSTGIKVKHSVFRGVKG